ncbi:MAG: hypothetical protein JW717_09260 [Marinilabiliaceae bacterium]|nr:hypothetical protein [Marinilabiliaceae bacterium]
MKPTYFKFVIIMLLFSGLKLFSQDYKEVVKLKAGDLWGVSFKCLTDFETGYEVLFHSNDLGISFTALRIFQTPAFPEKSSKWFFCYGYGTHISLYHHYEIYNPFTPYNDALEYKKTFGSLGIDGYAGFEYRFLKHPFVLSIDIIPNIEFFGPNYFRVNTSNMAFGLSYILK